MKRIFWLALFLTLLVACQPINQSVSFNYGVQIDNQTPWNLIIRIDSHELSASPGTIMNPQWFTYYGYSRYVTETVYIQADSGPMLPRIEAHLVTDATIIIRACWDPLSQQYVIQSQLNIYPKGEN